jgi:DNA repair protein RecN (Recombination protein N)
VIEEIRIRDLGVIEDAVLPLGPGFTAITGETGAGKTMILNGLSLLFGGRAESVRVRHGAPRAEVDATLRLALDSPAGIAVTERIEELGGVVEESTVILSRTVSAEGRSKAIAGGRPVPAAVLAEIGDEVIVVHGQADQRRLLLPQAQRDMVDRFGGDQAAQALAEFRSAYALWRDAASKLEEWRRDSEALAREAAGIKADLQQIEQVNPTAGEEHVLATEATVLAHAQSLRLAATTAHEFIAQDTDEARSVLDALAMGRKVLDQQREHDPRLAVMADALSEQSAVLMDLAADLASYAASIDDDPVRLSWVQQRLSELSSLTRRHGMDLESLLAWADEARDRLLTIDDDGSLEQRLSEAVLNARKSLDATAARLTSLRVSSAASISAAVSVELAELAMAGSSIEVLVHPVEAGPHGADEVEILLCSGGHRVPLAKGASGGELSRVMLALEVVIAHRDPVPIMVFDEVDAGVGGRAAVELGRRLCRLATDAQVIVVTHLPQVAAFADHHVVVRKEVGSNSVSSGIAVLTADQRVLEIARMLAGIEESDAATQHAQELLDLAEAERITRR